MRRLRLRKFFYDLDETNNTVNPFKYKYKWTPPINTVLALEAYIKSVGGEIQHVLDGGPSNSSNDNLTRDERNALFSLRKRPNIIIKPADKGSATVMMSKDDYLTRVMSHLNKTLFYGKLLEDPIERFTEDITSTLMEKREKEILNKDTFDFLCPKKVRTSWFYILPKIHKPGIPGRPIVLSCGTPTENISFIVDYHLVPLVRGIPSYLKHTNDFFFETTTN